MTRDFHERFTLKVELAEAKLRFVNRALNEVFEVNRSFDFGLILRKAVATEMGVHFFQQSFGQFIESDFLKALRAIETINRVAYGEPNPFVDEKWKLKALIKKAVPELLDSAEVDLNVRWDGNRFWPAGAALLDEALVNDSLRWLRAKHLDSVLQPFEKGLRHFLFSQSREELLQDVMTEMYEAVEALAALVIDRSRPELSKDRELFLSKISAASEFKLMLSAFIDYAQYFRHSPGTKTQRPIVTKHEAECFIYLTGVFLRLAIPSVEA